MIDSVMMPPSSHDSGCHARTCVRDDCWLTQGPCTSLHCNTYQILSQAPRSSVCLLCELPAAIPCSVTACATASTLLSHAWPKGCRHIILQCLSSYAEARPSSKSSCPGRPMPLERSSACAHLHQVYATCSCMLHTLLIDITHPGLFRH